MLTKVVLTCMRRLESLDMLSQHGLDIWKKHVQQLEQIRNAIQRHLEDMKTSNTALNKQRKASHVTFSLYSHP